MSTLLRRRLRAEDGSLLIELVVAMAMLALAIGALLAVFVSSMLSLRRATEQGTAFTLADRQMEAYKTLLYSEIQLDQTTVPASPSDPYKTAHAVDSSIPPASGQVWMATSFGGSCTQPANAVPECAAQIWDGPDGRQYRIDSYIVPWAPVGGRAGKRVTVVVRRVQAGAVGTKAIARVTSGFDPASPPQ